MFFERIVGNFYDLKQTQSMETISSANPAISAGYKLLDSGISLSDIRPALESAKLSASEIDDAMPILRKHHYAKRRHRGIINLLIGSLLLVAGCIVAVIMHDNSTGFRIALYTPSLVGTILACWGLIDIVGW